MPSIMIVDDSSYLRSVLRAAFERAGYDVVAEAENGNEAVERYAKYRPDVVTMDIVMPEVNGLTAIQRIMEFDNAARIVVITALGHEPMLKKALGAGALNFIIKPIEAREALAAVEAAVAGIGG